MLKITIEKPGQDDLVIEAPDMVLMAIYPGEKIETTTRTDLVLIAASTLLSVAEEMVKNGQTMGTLN